MKRWFLALLSIERRSGRHKVRVSLLRFPNKRRFFSLYFDIASVPCLRRACFHPKAAGAVPVVYVGMDSEPRWGESRAYMLSASSAPINLDMYDPVYTFVQIEEAYVEQATASRCFPSIAPSSTGQRRDRHLRLQVSAPLTNPGAGQSTDDG
jgi:hypothetical protein